jgi:hypothetical protein
MVGSIGPHPLDLLVDGVRHHSHIHFGGCGGCGPEGTIDVPDALEGCLWSCASIVSLLEHGHCRCAGGPGGPHRPCPTLPGGCSSLPVAVAVGLTTKTMRACRGQQPPSLHCCCCWQGGAPMHCHHPPRPGYGRRPTAPQCCGGQSKNSSPQWHGAREAAGMAAAEAATEGRGQRTRWQGTTIQTQGESTPPGWRLPGTRLPQGRMGWAQKMVTDVAL